MHESGSDEDNLDETLGEGHRDQRQIVAVLVHSLSDEEQLAAVAAEQDSLARFLEEQRMKGFANQDFSIAESELSQPDEVQDVYKVKAQKDGKRLPTTTVTSSHSAIKKEQASDRLAALEHMQTMRTSITGLCIESLC